MTTLTRKRMMDKLLDAYVDWREACGSVNESYRSWTNDTGRGGAIAFGLYMEALDAEEQAAECYAALVRRADKLFRSHGPLLEPLGGPAWGTDWP